MQNGNGVRIYLTINCGNLIKFLHGELVEARPDGEELYTARVRIRIDPDKFEIKENPLVPSGSYLSIKMKSPSTD